MEYLLQQYEDGTFGYLGIDGNEHYNLTTDSKVICTQGKNEDRDEFITKNKITFKPNQYGSNIKLDRMVNHWDILNHKTVAYQGYGLEKLINDRWAETRAVVASQGYRLEKLINDEDWRVRREVAKQKYRLDILINDEDFHVRIVVAALGYGLDKLINDENFYVRTNVANRGYGLDKLINDTHWMVRSSVASQGYGFEKLIVDKNEFVHKEVVKYLNEKADDNFIIDLGNKLLDAGYKLSTNDILMIFEDETTTKFKKFEENNFYPKNNVYRILARLLWKNIRVKDIYDPNYPMLVEAYLKQKGLLKDTDSIIDNLE